MSDPSRYLLPTERPVINIRRHWAVLAGITLQSTLLLVIGVLLARLFESIDFAEMVAVYFCVFVVARWLWVLYEWRVEHLIVTDKRLLLVTGIFSRNVAIMPLVKVTDLTFHRSATGLTLGYGKFVVESAGQDQALSTIDFVPDPERLYIQISELLFGGDKGAPGVMVTAAQREAEKEAEQTARRRWRRFTRRRAARLAEERPAVPAAPSQLDAILADRDTLLADRDDPDEWHDDRDETAAYTDTELRHDDFQDEDFREFRDIDEPSRRPDGTSVLPRLHEPPHRGRGDGVDPDPLLPPRRGRDVPAGHDPADD